MTDQFNALNIWRAIQNTARDEPLPDDVRAYLLEAADQLLALACAKEDGDPLNEDPPVTRREYALSPTEAAKKVPGALALDGNAIKRWRNRQASIGMAVRFESARSGTLRQDIEKTSASPSAVHRARRQLPQAVKRVIAHRRMVSEK